MALKGSERRKLKSMAHSLQPVVQIGKQGLSAEVLTEIDRALLAHELIKLRFQDYKDEKKEICAEVSERLQAENIGTVGHVAILFRPHPDPEKRKIQLG